MKLTILNTILLAFWFMLQGCGEDRYENSATTTVNRIPLEENGVSALCASEWRLQKMVKDNQQRALQPNPVITLTCDEQGRVAGMASVNRYSGAFELDDDGVLNWQDPGFITTKMAGPPALMEQEQDFLDILATTNQGYLKGALLVLQNEDESNLLEFTKATGP